WHGTVADRAVVAGAGDGADVHQRRDRAVGVDLADRVVERVRDVQVARVVEGDPLGVVEQRRGGRAAVAAVAAEAVVLRQSRGVVAGDGGDDPGGRVDAPDHVVRRVGDVEVVLGVHRHPSGLREPGRGGRRTVSGVAALAGAGHDLDGTGRGDLEDPVV